VAHLRGNIEGFEMVRGPRKLLVNSGDPQALFGRPQVEAMLARWYDYWLKGVETGVMDDAPVRLWIRNGAGYREEAAWPLARAQYRKLHLRPGPSGAAESLNDGRLTWEEPGSAPSATRYTYPDPEWTFPGTGSAVRGARGLVHETRRILTFTTDPFPSDLEVTGPLTLRIWASSSASDTQFIVRVHDLPPITEETTSAAKVLDVAVPSRTVTEGWLRASHRELDPERATDLIPYHAHTAPKPLEPGQIYEFRIEIWPTSWVFLAGHRLQLRLAALDQGGQYYLGHLRATDTIYHDSSHPSHLLLPVVPG
jgi:putative CocE/NonD family hydrolase